MRRGIVDRLLRGRAGRYGFIRPDDGAGDVLFVPAPGAEVPLPGWIVEFDAIEMARGPRAVNLKILFRREPL